MKGIFNKILSKGKIYEEERSLEKPSLLHRYARSKDRARYIFAARYIDGNRILNMACGDGYGSDFLLKGKETVVCGMDISGKAIRSAKVKYGTKKGKNLKYIVGNVYEIPFKKRYFDTVVSIETIEHLEDHEKFLSEIRRVLKKGGILIISSPDKIVEDHLFDNPHHINLLYKNDLHALLKGYFEVGKVFSQTPIITKPAFMIYFSFIFSSIFLSGKMVNTRKKDLTGTNNIFICRKI